MQDPCKQQKQQGKRKDWKNMWPGNGWIQLQALRKHVSDGYLRSFKRGYFRQIFFGLSLLPSSFLKKGVDRGKQSNQCDRETPVSARIFFFPVEEPIYSSLYFPTLMFSKLAWKWLHQLLERRSREMPMWDIVPKCPGGSPLQDWDAASETHLLFLWMLPERAIPPRSQYYKNCQLYLPARDSQGCW